MGCETGTPGSCFGAGRPLLPKQPNCVRVSGRLNGGCDIRVGNLCRNEVARGHKMGLGPFYCGMSQDAINFVLIECGVTR